MEGNLNGNHLRLIPAYNNYNEILLWFTSLKFSKIFPFRLQHMNKNIENYDADFDKKSQQLII